MQPYILDDGKNNIYYLKINLNLLVINFNILTNNINIFTTKFYNDIIERLFFSFERLLFCPSVDYYSTEQRELNLEIITSKQNSGYVPCILYTIGKLCQLQNLKLCNIITPPLILKNKIQSCIFDDLTTIILYTFYIIIGKQHAKELTFDPDIINRIYKRIKKILFLPRNLQEKILTYL